MDIQNYMSLFRACGRERNVKKALELLAELEASETGVDTTAYNCVLDVCIKCGDKRAVADLFTKMKCTRYVDTISYNTLLKGMGAGATGLTDASMILQEMRDLELRPNQITYNSLINFAISKGKVDEAWSFVENMEKESMPVDHFTCSIMMKGLRHSSAPTDVDRTLGLIERSAVTPDEVLVNTLLDACIRLKDVQRLTAALKTFRGSGVVPSEHAYGTVIKAYGHARAVDEAWATWKEMLSRKVSPTESTVAAMVEACVANGAASDAGAVLADLRSTGRSAAAPYLALLKGFAQKKEMAPALALYEDMQASAIELTAAAFNALIDVCARCGDVEQAAKVFRDMCARGVTPDLTTYSTIIKGYVVQGDLEQAIQLFTLMRKRGVQPDAVLFNTLLDGCARKQHVMLAGHVLSDMESSNIAPSNFTLQILVKLYGKNNDIDTAFSYVDAYPAKYGFEANAQVYTSLMAACVTTGNIAKAAEVFGKIQSPDAKAYTTLISGYLKAQDVELAVRRLQQALGAKVSIEKELADNVLFMAGRRKIDVSALEKQLAGAGLAQEKAASPSHARKVARAPWREAK
jgi:pentatricopeptide repeat protein